MLSSAAAAQRCLLWLASVCAQPLPSRGGESSAGPACLQHNRRKTIFKGNVRRVVRGMQDINPRNW